jgi:hypothetical protein
MRTLLVLATVSATVVACVARAQATPKRVETPAHFLAGVIRLLAANRYDDAWTSLAPSDQALAPRASYVACEEQSPIPGHLVSLSTLRIRNDRIGVAVTFAATIADAELRQKVRVIVKAHAVTVDGRWAWILSDRRRTLYRNGCGARVGPAA